MVASNEELVKMTSSGPSVKSEKNSFKFVLQEIAVEMLGTFPQEISQAATFQGYFH